MRVLVCGGRDFGDRDLLFRTLDRMHKRQRISWIIHGCARGADRLASEWAKCHIVPEDPYPADWSSHGRAAGPRRNQTMLNLGLPDVVVAFPGGRGTADMLRRAEAGGIDVLVVTRPETSAASAAQPPSDAVAPSKEK